MLPRNVTISNFRNLNFLKNLFVCQWFSGSALSPHKRHIEKTEQTADIYFCNA